MTAACINQGGGTVQSANAETALPYLMERREITSWRVLENVVLQLRIKSIRTGRTDDRVPPRWESEKVLATYWRRVAGISILGL